MKAHHCDGPGCTTWTFTLLEGWLRVRYIMDDRTPRHFCSPNCLAAWTAGLEWTEEVK